MGFKARIREPAWHRHCRLKRTAARALLVTFLRTGIGEIPDVVKAKDVLKQHHSRPALVAQVEEVLRTSQFNDMTTLSVSPYCAWCKQWGKKSAKFCALCSWEIHPVPISEQSYAATEAQPPWQSAQSWDSTGRVPSPRQRNQSPRRTGKGRDKGKGKGKGKDSGKDGKQGKGTCRRRPRSPPCPKPRLHRRLQTQQLRMRR